MEHGIFLDSDNEATDLYIMNHARAKDVAVTQDIGLASMLLSKKVYVMDPRGHLYDEKDIKAALHMRYLSAEVRRQGKYGKGSKILFKRGSNSVPRKFYKNFVEN